MESPNISPQLRLLSFGIRRIKGQLAMTTRHIDGFFYGLFMDSDVLRRGGARPEKPRRAFVDDFALQIGERATLIPRVGARSYGMLFALTHEELDRLYSPPGLADYRPEAVVAQTFEGESVPALCYNLPEAPRGIEPNAEYAARLRAALSTLGFPVAYVDSAKVQNEPE